MGKIDLVKLNKMLTSGKSPAECARAFGVSDAAICIARKKLNLSVVKNVALENAHKVVSQNLDAVAQLGKINACANELLDSCMAWIRGEDEALQVLESQVRKVRVGRGEETQEVTEYKFKDPREIALRAMAEIRSQLTIQLDIFRTLYDLEAVAEFQKEVLNAIGEESPDVKNRIIQRLKERRALRGSVAVN